MAKLRTEQNNSIDSRFSGKYFTGLVKYIIPQFICLSLIAVLSGSLSGVPLAFADSLEQARTAYTAGQFMEAAELAEAAGTSEAYALGSASLTAYGRFLAADEQKEVIFERAIEFAAKAIRIDPANADAYLQATRALGEYARRIGRAKVLNENIVAQMREHLEMALSIEENSASLHHSMARWHAELISRLGSFMANLLFEAKKKDAIYHLNRSIELEPKSKEVFYGLANGMLAISERKNHETARNLLQSAIDLQITDAYSEFIHQEAVDRLATLTQTEK